MFYQIIIYILVAILLSLWRSFSDVTILSLLPAVLIPSMVILIANKDSFSYQNTHFLIIKSAIVNSLFMTLNPSIGGLASINYLATLGSQPIVVEPLSLITLQIIFENLSFKHYFCTFIGLLFYLLINKLEPKLKTSVKLFFPIKLYLLLHFTVICLLYFLTYHHFDFEIILFLLICTLVLPMIAYKLKFLGYIILVIPYLVILHLSPQSLITYVTMIILFFLTYPTLLALSNKIKV